ncbi:unnamed protein product [Phaedon cochleariae]|uniref:Nuclear pore complex protein Nup153 n=1 Tax=Phaedon cochleariae TaxID=80249 RepID=A0A9N9SJ21_PHACE|nr:unnamed protein product [Phaedon cochleariae]
MEKDLNNSAIHNTSPKNEEDSEKSFVGKFKSIITNTPLSKWFRKQDDSSSKSTIRRRNDDADDEELHQMQPPSKRVKFPIAEENNHFNSVTFENDSDLTTVDITLKSQKSNHFPEPVAGPSGIKSRKLLSNVPTRRDEVRNKFRSRELLNGHKDSDSEESTSGYSSVPRIGSKDNVCHSQESSKQTSPLENPNNSRSLFQNPNTSTNRSLFTDRALSPNMNTSMTTRRPSFNASTFGSPNFIDRTIATEKIINSPFYSGRTIYGGASAYGRRLGRSARDLRTSLKRPVQIKPVNKTNETGNLTLGKTARRILETLEQYSSPINDAKKIPVASKRFKSDGLLTSHVGASPYLHNSGDTISKKRELQIPTVSDLLKMKQKTRLQNSTETVRQIAISSKSNLNSEQNLFSEKPPTRESDSTTDIQQQQKKVESVKPNPNPTSLPTTNLPKFDFFKTPQSVDKPLKNMSPKVAPLQTTIIVDTPPKVTIETENNVQKKNSDSALFRFSAPLVIAENMKSIVAINNFKFSKPLVNLKKTNSSNDKGTDTTSNKNGLEMAPKMIASPAKEQEKSAAIKNSGIGVKSANQWECSVCMVRNNDKDSKCVCCTASKPSAQKTEVAPINNIPSSFGDKFRLPTSMWECSVCMVRNENAKTKCSACETPNLKGVSNQSSSKSSSFMTKFQPPASTWECTTCLIRNKNEVVKCVACETPRIGMPVAFNSLSATFKKKEDEWECQVCMVRNKTTNVKCQCCESLKPGSNPKNGPVSESDEKPIPKFNFGIDKAAAASFSFGVPSSTSITLPKPVVDPAIVFGENAKKTAPVASFSFGVKPEAQSQKTTVVVPPKIAEPVDKVPEKSDASAAVASFQFGGVKPTTTQSAPLINKKVEAIAKPVEIPATTAAVPKPTFNFSVAASSSEKSTNKADTTAGDTPKLFSFGSKPSVNIAAKVTPAAGLGVIQSTPVSQPPAAVTSQNTISKPGGFSFGVNKTSADSSSSSIFGATTTTTNNSFAAANANSFGSPKAVVTPAPKTSSDVNASTPVPSFGSVPIPFGNTGKPAFESPSFSFGGAAPPSNEPPAKAPMGAMFSFGQSSFGAANSSTPSFNFAASKATEAPSSSIFGAAAPAALLAPSNAEATSRVFNFGASSQNNNTQKAGFSFGTPVNNNAAPVPTNSGFNFGAAAAPVPKPAAGGFNFSAVANFDGNVKPSFNFSDAPVTAFTNFTSISIISYCGRNSDEKSEKLPNFKYENYM